MRSLSLPIPVALFIRRLFNVFSSITISNQYLLARKSEAATLIDDRVNDDEKGGENTTSMRSEVLSGRLDTGSTSCMHWERLRPWPWNNSKKPDTPRGTHTTAPIDEENVRNHSNEKSMPPDPLPSTPNHRPPRTNSDAPLSPIYSVMNNPMLFSPVRAPRNPIVLCHGLYGYDVRGPSYLPMFQLHYWANVLKVLKKKLHAEVIVTGVPGTGSIESRAERLHGYLREKAAGRDINFMAHSMGGLDCRHLITHVKPKEYNPLSLMTICTPHRGSPFMDWCKENIGIGKLWQQAKEASEKTSKAPGSSSSFSLLALPSSLTAYVLSVLDSPAYANLTTHYLQDVFNPATPDDPRVRYYSVAARTDSMSVLHPLWLPKTVLDGSEARERNGHPHPEEVDWGNDGLVTVRSAKWGEFLGTMEGCDHWDVRGGGGLGPDSEWSVDIAIPNALKNSLSEPFSLVNSINWKRFAAWAREEEEREKNESKVKSETSKSVSSESVNRSIVEAQTSKLPDSALKPSPAGSRPSEAEEDAALKSSTDKLSAVFDWVSNQVASSRKPSDSSKSSSQRPITERDRKAEEERVRVKKASETGDERLKFDLERFYVALCRKLYDDGL